MVRSPVDICFGTRPSHAAFAKPIAATIALAKIPRAGRSRMYGGLARFYLAAVCGRCTLAAQGRVLFLQLGNPRLQPLDLGQCGVACMDRGAGSGGSHHPRNAATLMHCRAEFPAVRPAETSCRGIFEEKPLKYVFRATPHATMDNVAAARYVLKKLPELASFSGINQNYAWGQDSWRDFVAAMKTLAPKAAVDKELLPKLFAGEFGAEISALLTTNSKVVHSSFWDGDLESFIVQNGARGLPARSTMVYTAGETAMFRLGAKIPDGTIIGARGPHGVMAPDTPLNKWFRQVYEDRFATAPTYPAYHMAQSILGLKSAWEKAAAAKGGQQPAIDDIVKAFEGIEFEGPSAKIRMAIGGGHQGIADIAYGTFRFNKAEGKAEIVDVVRYPAECVNPPANMTSTAWLEAGMPGAKCN